MPKHCTTCRSTHWSTRILKNYQWWWHRQFADVLTRVWVVEHVKKEADTLAGVKAFPCLDTLKKLKQRELSIRRLARFDKCRPKVLPTP